MEFTDERLQSLDLLLLLSGGGANLAPVLGHQPFQFRVGVGRHGLHQVHRDRALGDDPVVELFEHQQG